MAATTTYDEIIEALSHVFDPELGINIVDLGLVYDVVVQEGHVQVALTLTTPACPLGSVLTDDVRHALTGLPGVESVEVELVWSPAWHPMMMSAWAKQQLGWA
jgi:metal-sulfur cluster biosynthetic enzyme